MTLKYWKIFFSLKRGATTKYKKQLKYIDKTYKPHFLSISQLTYYDHFRSRPIPHIEFIVLGHDALHFMDDFIEKFPKVLVTGGAKPYKWARVPRRNKKIIEMIKKRKVRETKIADKMRKQYQTRLRTRKNKGHWLKK